MSKIEWTEKTWNAFVGCRRVSAGCMNCYAEVMSMRMGNMTNNKSAYDKYEGITAETAGGDIRFTGKTRFYEEALHVPLTVKRPTTFFVNSMSDTFYEGFSFEQVDKILEVIRQSPHHTYQVLTKRAKRMHEYFTTHYRGEIPANVWVGVTAENTAMANERVPYLLGIPATVKFLSVEPMLEAMDISAYLPRLQWVIVGGESGNGDNIRPMRPEWARDIAEQCAAYEVPFFFKQVGRFLAKSQASPEQAKTLARRLKTIGGVEYFDCGKLKGGGGKTLDGLLMQEYPKKAVIQGSLCFGR